MGVRLRRGQPVEAVRKALLDSQEVVVHLMPANGRGQGANGPKATNRGGATAGCTMTPEDEANPLGGILGRRAPLLRGQIAHRSCRSRPDTRSPSVRGDSSQSDGAGLNARQVAAGRQLLGDSGRCLPHRCSSDRRLSPGGGGSSLNLGSNTRPTTSNGNRTEEAHRTV